jgi:hypothetical protein
MRALALAFACLAAACTPAAAQETALALRVPAEEKVAFRGFVSQDGAVGAQAAPLYPSPNVVGAIAALVTHGILVDSVRRSREEGVQKAADNVLKPHRELLDRLTHRELMQEAAARMTVPGGKLVVDADAKPAAGLVLDNAPVFAMTQDAQAILLDNAIVLRRAGDDEAKAAKIAVRIVSAPQEAAAWSQDGGRLLKEQAAALLAQSYDLALGAASRLQAADAPQRTVRYRQGKEERMERAQVLDERCDRLLIRNLRGWLMSVPVACEQAPAEPPKN